MDWNFELKEQNRRYSLSIRTTTTMAGLPLLIGQNYHKLAQYLEQIGEQLADMPYTAYYKMDMTNMDVEMGFPVARPLPGQDEIKAGEIPEGLYASGLFKGSYSGLESMYSEMFKWVESQGLQATGIYYEFYLNSPQEVPESELLTRVEWPVKRKA